MSRYLERAEHLARLLDVNLHQTLDEEPDSDGRRWDRLLVSLRTTLPDQATNDAYRITHALTVDTSNPTSIVSCIASARDNARQAWEQISSEMWEQINRLYLQVNAITMDQIWLQEPHAFFVVVKEGAHLFQGITDATLSHGEGWQFIQVGRYIERARATADLLDAHFLSGGAEPQRPTSLGYLEWVGLLKFCTAFEAYMKYYNANVEPERIAAFLLLNAEFPRSVRFVAGGIQDSLHAIARTSGTRGTGKAERLAGRLRAALDYGQIDEIMAGDLHTYLQSIRQQCEHIHTAIYQTFIQYAVGAALAAQRQAV
jgi:uncharacterized alpha-E superfamily protein